MIIRQPGSTGTTIKALKCKKCGWLWVPRRIDVKPLRCSNCNNKNWNKPYSAKPSWANKGLPPGYLAKNGGRYKTQLDDKIKVGDLIKAIGVTRDSWDGGYAVHFHHPNLAANGTQVSYETWVTAINLIKDEQWDNLDAAWKMLKNGIDGVSQAIGAIGEEIDGSI